MVYLFMQYPVRVKIEPLRTLRALLEAALFLSLLGGAAMIWRLSQERYHPDAWAFIGSRSTLITLLAISLASLPLLPATLVARTELRGAVSPPESLRLDRRADIVVTLSWRSVITVLLGLWSGAQIALAYAVFAAASVLITTLLGGQLGFISRSYIDACLWLACRRRLPRRAMAFMADAEVRGVLRAVGASYEFRHIRVEQELHDVEQERHDVEQERHDVEQELRDWWEKGRWERFSVRWAKLRDLGERLGRWEQSLDGLNQKVKEYRELAERSPYALEVLGPKLAVALSDFAAKADALGRRDDSVDALSERVSIYRKLAGSNPGKFRPELAQALTRLAGYLQYLERYEEYLGVTREAVDIWHELVSTDSKFHLDLARPLHILASKLKDFAQRKNGLELLRDAVQCYRGVADTDAAFRPWLAEALTHLASALQASGLSREHEVVTAEMLDMYRKFAEEKVHHDATRRQLEQTDPSAYLWLPREQAADRRFYEYTDAEETEKTLAACRRAVATYRNLARTTLGAFLRDLKRSLDRLADESLRALTSEEFLGASHESYDIWNIYLTSWTTYLWADYGPFCLINDVALPLWKAGRRHDVLTVIEIAQTLGGARWLDIDYNKRAAYWRKAVARYRWRKILAQHGWPDTIGSNQLRGQAGVRVRSGVQACPARASRMACMGGTALSLMVIR